MFTILNAIEANDYNEFFEKFKEKIRKFHELFIINNEVLSFTRDFQQYKTLIFSSLIESTQKYIILLILLRKIS